MIKRLVDTILALVTATPAPQAMAGLPPAPVRAPPIGEAESQARFASRLEAAAADPDNEAVPLVAGSLEIVGLDDVREALGERWGTIAEQAMAIAEAELQAQLGDTDIFRPYGNFSFLVCFAELDSEQAARRAGRIALDLKTKLILQIPELAQVVGVEQFVGSIDRRELRLEGMPITDRLFATLQRIREETWAAARRSRQVLLRDIQVQFVPAWHTAKNVVILNRSVLDQTSGARTLAQFQGMAQPTQIHQTLAELDCLLLTKSIEALHNANAASSRGSSAMLVPVSFRTLGNFRWRSDYCRLLKIMPDLYKGLLFLEIYDVPIGGYAGRLDELLELLNPLIKGVAVEVPLDYPDLSTVVRPGLWALAVNIAGSGRIDRHASLRLKQFAEAATAARTISLAHGANSLGLARAAVEAGFTYVDGPAIHPTMREPKAPSPLSPLANMPSLNVREARW
jgi:hypothetical protein